MDKTAKSCKEKRNETRVASGQVGWMLKALDGMKK